MTEPVQPLLTLLHGVLVILDDSVECGILHAGTLGTKKASSLSSWVYERLDSYHLNIKLLVSTDSRIRELLS